MEILLEEKPATFDAIKFEGGVQSAEAVISWFDDCGVTALYHPGTDQIRILSYSSDRDLIRVINAGLWIVNRYDKVESYNRFVTFSDDGLSRVYKQV